ncbi:hypothetical protein H4219_001973 [Mycoemilia scoparia]|uniref:MFS general substrate transporter n=1 Tax=Mycoemilia scoparia TaxID=417184 RepID=A0A9W8DR92_9FUNG|nr:hypothetical protein H4219_001973 [Mycoemilia scoparia]
MNQLRGTQSHMNHDNNSDPGESEIVFEDEAEEYPQNMPRLSYQPNVYWQSDSPVGYRSRIAYILHRIEASETWKMFTLTVGFGGLQFLWSVETGYGSPYLLSLGLRSSLTSLVWLAGPLSGIITQPLIGVLSDRCHLEVTSPSLLSTLKATFVSIRHVPYTIQQVYTTQFFSWIGWFPFLFYNTTFVASIYRSSTQNQNDTGDPSDSGPIGVAARVGSLSMLLFSIVSLVCSLVLPSVLRLMKRVARFASLGFSSQAASSIATRLSEHVSLPGLWTFSLVFFGIAMLSTFFVSKVYMATALIALCGFSWSVTIWVPFALIGQCLNAGRERADTYRHSPEREYDEAIGEVVSGGSFSDHESDTTDAQLSTPNQQQSLDHSLADERLGGHSHHTTSAGTILGIHNIYVSMPQFITAFICSVVFYIFELMEGPQGAHDPNAGDDDFSGVHARAIGWVLRLGGVASFVAAYISLRLKTRPSP